MTIRTIAGAPRLASLPSGPFSSGPGKTNKEIAAEVYLSDKTVKNYVSSILSKLNLQRRAQAAAFVARHRPGGIDA